MTTKSDQAREFWYPANWELMEERDREIYGEMMRRANLHDELVAALYHISALVAQTECHDIYRHEAIEQIGEAARAVLAKVGGR
jgi:hypothetical protein